MMLANHLTNQLIDISMSANLSIDYIRLLGLEGTDLERDRLPERLVYNSATDLSLLFLFIFILFNKVRRGVFQLPGSLVAAHALPAGMVVFFVYKMLVPPASRKVTLALPPCTIYPTLIHPNHLLTDVAPHALDGARGALLPSLLPRRLCGRSADIPREGAAAAVLLRGISGDVRLRLAVEQVRFANFPNSFFLLYNATLIVIYLLHARHSLSLAASESDAWWQDSQFFRLFLVPFVTPCTLC